MSPPPQSATDRGAGRTNAAAAAPLAPPANTIVQASAGSGKTYQLSVRYIRLLASGARPDAILATTFTRKAAGEILRRVLGRLARASAVSAECERLATDVGTPLSRADVSRLLREVVAHLHRLRVSTLDSFFGQVAGCHGLELALPPRWGIAPETVDVRQRDDAIQYVFREESQQDLLTLLALLEQGDTTRRIAQQTRGIVDDLYQLYRTTSADAWKALHRRKPLNDDALSVLIERFLGLKFEDSRSQTAHVKACPYVVNGDWRSLLDSGLGKKIAAGELTYFNAPIEPEAVEVYRSVIDHASSELTNQLIDRTWATRDLLERFDERYWRLKERSGQLTFDDVTFALARAAWTDFGDVASFRLDGRIQHLLLDEFQDTSWPQWRVLEPLVRECLVPDAGKSFFCVGDVKQAIYGWRGGHAGILQRLHQHLENVHEESLTRSYRSAPAVIDLVNLVFGNLTQNPALARWRRAAQDWTEGFRPHETVKHDAAGYCRLREAERADDDEKQRHATLRTVVDEVTAIHEAAPTAEIGVLLRANDDVSRVILDLRLRYGIEASEEAGATLTNSPAVALVMSALRLADHPGDTVVRTHLAHSPLAQLFGGLETGDEEAGRQSRRIRHALLQNGYGETIRRWAAQLAPACDARDARRLDQLIDVALAYEPIATLRPSDFVRHVELQRVVDPVAARVRVMNIHQSKGLEFDAVVMAASGESMNRAPRVVASAPNPFAPVNRVLRYANETVQALLPDDARETFAAHKNNDVREQLNVLYVAVTRAVRALHIVVPPSARPNDSCAWLLRHALASGGNGAESMKTTPEDNGFLREMGDAAWCRDFAADVAGASRARGSGAAAELADEIVFARSPRQEIRRHATPSGGAADESSDSAALDLTGRFNAVGRVARKRGSLYHRWMELVEWLDDAEPTDEALCISAAEFRLSRPELQRHIDAFRSLLEQPNIRQALCRSAYQGDALAGGWNGEVRTANGCSLWRELPFAQVAATGWTTGRFDRLVAVRQGDRTVAADVIDFKTDAIAPHDADAVAAAVESHRAQMTSYGRAACRLLDLPPSRVRLRLLLLSVDVAVDVTHVATGDNS